MRISSRKKTTADCRAARSRAAAFAYCLAALIGGCKSAPETTTVAVAPSAGVAQRSIDEARAATDAGRRAVAYLRALTALHEEGDLETAATIVADMRSVAGGKPLIDALDAAARFRFDAIALELMLTTGEGDELARYANALVPTDANQRRRADDLLVRVFAKAADHATAAVALIAIAERGLYTDAERLAGHIWRRLSKLPLPALAQAAQDAAPRTALWLRLAHDLNAALTHAERVRIWRLWRATHAEHVAVRLPPPGFDQTFAAAQVALLLPFSGDLAAFAETIRDGFLAAYLRTLQRLQEGPDFGLRQAFRQVIRFYDTGAMSVGAAYRQATADGADVIVGPLDKAAVGELAALSPAVPVLALNSVGALNGEREGLPSHEGALSREREGLPSHERALSGEREGLPSHERALSREREGTPSHETTLSGERQDTPLQRSPAATSNFLQLTLAVEDPAVAIAAAIEADGAQRIVLFDNQGAWSPRARARLAAELDEVEIVAVGTLGGIGNVTEAAGEVLGIAASTGRQQELARLLGTELTFLPRRRQDVDAVVALVDGVQLAALRPALEFHFAGDLPIYGPSQAVRGVSWRQLDGMRVCTIPWFVQASGMRAQATVFEASDDPLLAPLFALGVDAYRIVNQLDRLTELDESIAGSVGMLSLGDQGRIRRELGCGTVANGRLTAAPMR